MPRAPGVAYADLRVGVPGWLTDEVRHLRREVDAVLVMPHWGPNMTAGPEPYIRSAAAELIAAGATLVAGHSAHVFHGVADRIAYDLGNFVDDYRVDPDLRNDLGILALLTLDDSGPRTLRAVPLELDFCYTRLAGRARLRVGRPQVCPGLRGARSADSSTRRGRPPGDRLGTSMSDAAMARAVRVPPPSRPMGPVPIADIRHPHAGTRLTWQAGSRG